MNSFRGTITDVTTSGPFSRIKIDVSGVTFTSIVTDTPESCPYLTLGHEVKVIIKESEVIIAVGERPAISLRNQIPGVIKSIDVGDLLGKLTIHTSLGDLVSIITAESVHTLGLEEGKPVLAMIKTNEVMIAS